MDITNKHYPYPVLKPNGDDYIKSEFCVTVIPSLTPEKVIIQYIAKLNDSTIKKLIDAKLASIICHIEASQTTYRKTVEIPLTSEENGYFTGELNSEILSDEISGKVNICPFIISIGEFNYYNINFNPEYGGMSFPIDEGAVLAEGNQISFEIPIVKNALEYTPSIFVTVPIKDPNIRSIVVDYLNDEKIIIRMPENMYRHYKGLNNSEDMRPQLWSMIIVPCMVNILDHLKNLMESKDIEELDEFKEKQWYKSINNAMKKYLGYEIDSEEFIDQDTVLISEMVLKNPLEISLNSLTGNDGMHFFDSSDEL